MKKIKMILAVDEKNGLGKKGDLAWKISDDMKYFKKITTDTQDLAKLNAIVMGKKTWESIPLKFRPFSNRINCILSRSILKESIDSKIDDFVLYFNSIESCIDEILNKENVESIFIIGGADIYNQFLFHPKLDEIYLTQIKGDYNCDVFFNGIPNEFTIKKKSEEFEENGVKFRYFVYKK